MTISIVTLGCKVNGSESASILAALKKNNYDASEGLMPADVYVLNTCSVTAEADRKSRQYIAKMQRLNPSCKIIVIGCSSQNSKEKFEKDNVIAIGGTRNKSNFVLSAVKMIEAGSKYSIISDRILYQDQVLDNNKYGIYEEEDYPESKKTRSFIKIQDGCNRFCSYCIIPYLRGRSRSRSIADIVAECKKSISKEIVLTGIDISYYGRDINTSLRELVTALSEIDARKRLGSLECEIITDDLLYAMSDANFCPHFHLSLQSGDDSVLESMNRRYDTKYFYDRICMIRDHFPLAGITTDVIVGFPTESDKSFKNSCIFIEKCRFSDIHVFPYSTRKGTLASRKYSSLPKQVVEERKNTLLELKRILRNDFIDKNIGTVARVYAEDTENGYNVGYTPNYIKVYSTAPRGEISDIKLTRPFDDGALGIQLSDNIDNGSEPDK